METVKKRWIQFISALFSLSKNEYLILLLIFSAFISVYFLAGLMIVLPLYILVTKQGKLALPKEKSSYLILIFAGSAMLSTFLRAEDADVNGFILKADLLKLLSIGIVILCFDIFFFVNIMTKRAFHLSLKLSAIMSIFCLIVGLIQNHLDIYASPLRPGRHASVFMNENYYGTVIEFIVLITLFLLFRETNRKKQLFYGFVLLCNLIGLWLCECRTAYIVIACSVFLFFFVYKRKTSLVVLFITCIVSVLLYLYPHFLPRFETATEYLDFRLGIWNAAIKCIFDHPLLGCGYFSYSNIWKEYSNVQYFALHAHNLYIEVLLNFGVIGTFFLAAFSIKKALSSIQNCIKSKDRLCLALVASAITAVVVHGLADTTLFWPQTGIFPVLLISIPHLYDTTSET